MEKARFVRFTMNGSRTNPGNDITGRYGNAGFKVSKEPGDCTCVKRARGEDHWSDCPSQMISIQVPYGDVRVNIKQVEEVAAPVTSQVPALS